jgi:PAS domain S-box-containing protein
MTARVRAMDWSRTPTGPIENWPLILRAAVDLCLNSRFPMHVWWGSELVYIYDDAHIPVLGRRHPDALGQSAAKVWAEVWSLLGPQVDVVMLHGKSTWNERVFVEVERNGFREDAWFTWSYSPIRDESGRVGGLMCIATEDTARVLAERERDRLEEQRQKQRADEQAIAEIWLPDSTALLSAISDSTQDAIFAKDRDGRLRFANPATLALIGKPLADVLGKTDAEFLEDILVGQAIMENDRRIMDSGISAEIEEIVPLPDGTHRVWLSRKMPNKDAAGNVIGLLGVSRDITNHKRAEETQAKLAAIVESSDDGIIGKTLDGIIVTWNHGAERIFGYTSGEVVGKHILMLIPVERQHEETDIQRRLARGEPIEHFETVRLTKEGRRIDVSLTVSPIRNAAGTVVGASKIVRDITAKKKAEESLARQAEELARSNVELERFAYIASHDLQEPLRSIHSFAQLLQREVSGNLSGNGAEYLGYITGGVKRMRTLINDLLAYSRVNSQGAAFTPADCNEICTRVLMDLQASIESKQARIAIEPLPVVIGDATQLGQLFQNLLINAIKFHGSQAPYIRVAVTEAPSEWIFSVTDNGIGIAPEYFDRIFIIFQRLHTIEEYSGTGIGLAVCKKIAERHGGRIWVESVSGKGSTFYFSLLKRGKTT